MILCREKLAKEVVMLESERAELSVEILLFKDKHKQNKDESAKLSTDVEDYRQKLQSATQDYVSILLCSFGSCI
jgi:hypothetical protein